MIPEGDLAPQAIVTAFVDPIRGPVEYLSDYEYGGVALNDGSQGLNVKLWELRVVNDQKEVQVSAPDVPWTTMFVRVNKVEEAALAFDNNMNPFVTFLEESGTAYYWWYDTSDSTQKFTALPAGTISPRCCVDDKRETQSSARDVVLTYLRAGTLYARYQRERYLMEHALQAGLGPDARIIDIGMNRGLRLQWWMRNANPVAGAVVNKDPFLGDVVTDICREAGMTTKQVNVEDLYDDLVSGLRIDSDNGLATPIQQLREVFPFDKSEHDKKIYFPMRGRDVVARIPYKHLIRGNPTALKMDFVDPSKLPKEVNVTHLDPDGGFAQNKQFAMRRSNMIKTTTKKNIDTRVVLTVDQAADAAEMLLRIEYNEQITYTFKTTIRYTELTVGDVIEVEDKGGTWHRMRIEDRNEDGDLEWTCKQDAGQRTYGKTRTGNALPPPVSTTPGLVGETLIEIINCSPLIDQDDELGLYIAAAGTNSAWTGYQMLVSTDGGTTYVEAYRASAPSTIGETVTDLPHAIGYEYQSVQSVEVLSNFPLASINDDQLLTNQNRIVIGDEILQFKTATSLGLVGTQYHYRLTGLLRGRYATATPAWSAGARFVLIDETLVFAQAQRSMLGLDLHYKPVSFGLTEDETIATAYLFDEAASQTEWPVDNVQGVRVSGDVVVSFTGRMRLGMDTAPFHSKYFAGYRIKFDDGHTIDTMNETATYSGAPANVSFQVCALNTITGEGPLSISILVP